MHNWEKKCKGQQFHQGYTFTQVNSLKNYILEVPHNHPLVPTPFPLLQEDFDEGHS